MRCPWAAGPAVAVAARRRDDEEFDRGGDCCGTGAPARARRAAPARLQHVGVPSRSSTASPASTKKNWARAHGGGGFRPRRAARARGSPTGRRAAADASRRSRRPRRSARPGRCRPRGPRTRPRQASAAGGNCAAAARPVLAQRRRRNGVQHLGAEGRVSMARACAAGTPRERRRTGALVELADGGAWLACTASA